MNLFLFYLHLGIKHILDIEGYDHILFIASLVAVYSPKEWKKVIILATAFTIGHSTTLALATLNIISVPTALIEFLIGLTIFLTGFVNLFKTKEDFNPKLHWLKYGMAMFFGLIHGMGFSNYLRFMLGQENHIFKPLLAFNVGLELGQLVVIAITLSLETLLTNVFHVKRREWNLVISGAAMGMAFMIMMQRLPMLATIKWH